MTTPIANTIYSGAVLLGNNNAGTDYFCSEISGRFGMLEDTLNEIGFDKETDRLISLGNSIGNTEKSCLAHVYLSQPWFIGVRGWQEDLLVSALIANGGDEIAYLKWTSIMGDGLTHADPEVVKNSVHAIHRWPYVLIHQHPLSGLSHYIMNRELPRQLTLTDHLNMMTGLRDSSLAAECFDQTAKLLRNGIEIDLLDAIAGEQQHPLLQPKKTAKPEKKPKKKNEDDSALFAIANGEETFVSHKEATKVVVANRWLDEEVRFNTTVLESDEIIIRKME